MVTGADIHLADGRTLHAYDTRPDRSGTSGSPAAVFWHHGSPNIGSPPEPLFAAAEASGLHWISYDRPGYGGSSPHDGRTVGVETHVGRCHHAVDGIRTSGDALAHQPVAVWL